MSELETEIFMSGVVNISVREVRTQEKAMKKSHDSMVRETLGNLARRHPNRIYFSPEFPSLVGYVLKFWEPEEEIPWAVYMEISPFTDGFPSGDWRISRTPKKQDLETAVEQWKDANGLPSDLIGNPSIVYKVEKTLVPIYMHAGETSEGFLVWQYMLSGNTPRMDRVLQIVESPSELESNLTQISTPPQAILDYARL